MLKAVIIDDEQLAIEELKYLMSYYPQLIIDKSFTNPIEGELYINENPPDVVFLDIQMPRRTGLEIAKHMLFKNMSTKIIFVTAHDIYAIEAFEVSAFDYLLKPITKERLDFALQKVIKQINNRPTLLPHSPSKEIECSKNFISLYHKGVYEPVKLSDILYCHSDEGLVTIHTEKQKYHYSGNFTLLEETLKCHFFFKCHRSYIINVNHVEKIEPTERAYLVKLKASHHLIPVSRSNAQLFKKIMSIY